MQSFKKAFKWRLNVHLCIVYFSDCQTHHLHADDDYHGKRIKTVQTIAFMNPKARQSMHNYHTKQEHKNY